MLVVVALVSTLHFLGSYIAVSLSYPGAGSLESGAEAWKNVLGFPLVTIHDAIFGPFGPSAFGQGSWRSLAIQFWVGGNSFLWGAGIPYGVRGVFRRLRDRP